MNELEKKYFINKEKFNCPLCKTNSVLFDVLGKGNFNWDSEKKAYLYLVKCTHCGKKTFHLSYSDISTFENSSSGITRFSDTEGIDLANLDEYFFYSVPRSQFSADDRIPSKIRGLLFEAAGCLHMNYLTGASACLRKAIYELLVVEGLAIKGTDTKDYGDKIKSLKDKYSRYVNPAFFDMLAGIQGITSDQLHENAWEEMEASEIDFMLELIKIVIHDMKVKPIEQEEAMKRVLELKSKVGLKDKGAAADKK